MNYDKDLVVILAPTLSFIKRVYLVDPLKCECGGTLRVIGFITEHKVIRKILDHLDKRNGYSRAPPNH